MKRFSCACGNPVFYENTFCTSCGARLGFDPARLTLVAVQQTPQGNWQDSAGSLYDLCRNTLQHDNCNWLNAAGDPDPYCVSCRLNRTIPNLDNPENRQRWRSIENAKRRLLFTFLQFGLDVLSKTRGWPHGLAFDFIEDTTPLHGESGRVLTGHEHGIITINVAEADDVVRTMTRKQMNERYRTLLGHFRHESGHYYFPRLVNDGPQLDEYRRLFGDETLDYTSALDHYYSQGPAKDWPQKHISAYASAHSAEDWAETWAHYLHMYDCLDTAAAYGLSDPPGGDFDQLLQRWQDFSVVLNELNRSMGMRDAYPFWIIEPVAQKLRFVDTVLNGVRSRAPL